MGIHPAAAAAAHAIEAYIGSTKRLWGDHPIYDDHHQVHEEMVFECMMMRMDELK